MKKYHPVIAIILGNFVTGILISFLPNISLSDILAVFILILGGFVATYISRNNKAIIGFYEGLLFSIGTLIGIIFIFKTELTFYSVLYLALSPILAFVGGLIGKVLMERLYNKK